MTEKEYEEFDNNFFAVNTRIKNYEERLNSIEKVYKSILDKNNKIDMMTINIQLQDKRDNYSHEYYDTDSKKIMDCVKSEIENEIEKCKKGLNSWKKEKERLLNSVSINNK